MHSRRFVFHQPKIFHLQAGPVTKINRPVDRNTKELKKFAFALFDHEATIPYAIHMLNGVKLFGRAIRCQARNSTGQDDYRTVGMLLF